MKLSANKEGALVLEEIPDFLLQALERLPTIGGSTNARVEERFFPAPSPDAGIAEDWKSFVQPELHEWFVAARDVVQSDLRTAKHRKSGFAFQIPRKHQEAWLNALNQARLAIFEENRLTEADMDSNLTFDPEDPHSMAVFQIGFYGFLLDCLVRLLEGDSE